jgi:hypothetical protein
LNKKAKVVAPLGSESVKVRLEKALDNAETDRESRAAWFDRSEALELVIIGPVFDDEGAKDSDAYKKLTAFLEKVAADKSTLDTLGYGTLSNRYSKVTLIPFAAGSTESERYDAAYAHRLYDKSSLLDVLRQYDGKKNYQELALSIDADALEEGKLILKGYKSVVYQGKQQNAHYFQLIKANVDTVTEQMIADGVTAILKLPIPEYISIEREDIIDHKALKVVNQNPDGTYTATVYKMKTDLEIEKLNKARAEELKRSPDQLEAINKKYDAQIAMINKASEWIKYQSRQLLYTTPVTQEEINILYDHGYITKVYDAEVLTAKEAAKIASATGTQLPDYYLTLSYDTYKESLNRFGIEIAEVQKILDTYYIKGNNLVSHENSEAVSAGVSNAVRGTVSFLTFFMTRGYSGLDTAGGMDENYTGFAEEPLKSRFFPVSRFAHSNIGVEIVYEQKFSNFDHSLMTIPKGTPFLLKPDDRLIGLVNIDKKDKYEYDFAPDNSRIWKGDVLFVDLYERKEISKSRVNDMKYTEFINYEQTFKEYVSAQKSYLSSLDLESTPQHYFFFTNRPWGVDHYCGIGGVSQANQITRVSLKNGNYLNTYSCSIAMDVFDGDDNFITRFEEHNDATLGGFRFGDYVITNGANSTKIWDVKVFDFMLKSF